MKLKYTIYFLILFLLIWGIMTFSINIVISSLEPKFEQIIDNEIERQANILMEKEIKENLIKQGWK